MSKYSFKMQYARTSAMRAIVVAVVLILLFCVHPDTASAVCPEGYVTSVENENLDWYMSALDIDYVADFVQRMLDSNDSYDFSDLEKNPIVIAVIDTGINFEHEIFEGKYDKNGTAVDGVDIGEYDVFLRDSYGNIISKNAYDTSGTADDDAYDKHGTHVAGIVATLIHKLNLEKYIKIMPIKASYRKGTSSVFPEQVLKSAVDFALENGADVINMSLADTGISPNKASGYDFVTSEMANKAIFLSASGNEGKSSSYRVSYPAGSKYVIGVMNYTMENDVCKLSEKSNYGSKYDICFPGASIYSADGNTNNEYKALSGTSMATPIASFACALKTLQNRALCQKNNVLPKTPQEIASIVLNSYTQTIKKGVFELKVFDFKKLLGSSVDLQISADKNEIILSKQGDNTAVFTAYLEDETTLPTISWKVKNSQGVIVDNSEGVTYEFAQNAVDTYTVTAYCQIGGETMMASMSIKVKYLEHSAEEILSFSPKIIEDGADENITVTDGNVKVPQGKHLSFEIDNYDYENVSPTTDVLWYVNGTFVRSGNTFEYDFQEVGEYNVQAKINGIFTSSTKIVVEGEQSAVEGDSSPNVLAICCLVLGGVIVLAFVLTLTLASIKRKV